MSKKQRIIYALETMERMFADYPLTELEYTNPFQLLVAVMLSAQTTDKQVNKVSATFFDHVKTPADVLTLGEGGVKEHIKTVGLHKSKTINLVKTAQILHEKNEQLQCSLSIETGSIVGSLPERSLRDEQKQYPDRQSLYQERGLYIPDTIDEMLTLPGVGIKTAKVLLYLLYGQKVVAVDTHVHRVMNRLGFVRTTNPDKTSQLLEKHIPNEYKDLAHRVIIYFGRYHCTARNPHCSECPLQSICPAYKRFVS